MSIPDDIKRELLARAAKEQKIRARWEKDWDNKEIQKEAQEADAKNTVFLKKVVKEYGWPKISEVGKDVAMAAWLMLQHSPDKKFMEDCLKLMQKAPHEVEPANLARTIDRVRILNGQKQYYGTHFEKKDGQWLPIPIDDEKNVEERRAKMGLPKIEQKKNNIKDN